MPVKQLVGDGFSPDVNGLDIDELADAEDGELATESGLFDAAEGEPWIGADGAYKGFDTTLIFHGKSDGVLQ